MKSMQELLPAIIDIAEQAGAAIMPFYCHDCVTVAKQDQSPLTEADLAAHRLIVARLAAISALPVLSEESVQLPWQERRKWTRYWLVDPLDGTKEFLKSNGEFSVNIALIEEGRPVLGVVHAPALQRTYYAARGLGAFRRDQDKVPQPIHVSPKADGPWRVVGSRSHCDSRTDAFLAALGEVELVPMGSSLKFCVLAEGGADLYPRLGPTSEWDTAAAQCVVEQAGGEVLQVLDDGLVPLRYNAKESLLNPDFIACAARSPAWMAFFAGGAHPC